MKKVIRLEEAAMFLLLIVLLSETGFAWWFPTLLPVGAILFGHSSMDRILGYGLKHADSFKNTHLGPIG